jgi:hypothetical protein
MTRVIFLVGFLFENVIILVISFGIKCVNFDEGNLNEEQWEFQNIFSTMNMKFAVKLDKKFIPRK